MSEPFLNESPQLGEALLSHTKDFDPQVLLQMAFSLGEWRDPRAGQALGELALQNAEEPFLVAAVLSSIDEQNITAVLTGVADWKGDQNAVGIVIKPLLNLAAALQNEQALAALFAVIAEPQQEQNYAPWQFAAMSAALDGFARNQTTLAEVQKQAQGKYAQQLQKLSGLFTAARKSAADQQESEEVRQDAIRLLGRGLSGQDTDMNILQELLTPRTPASLQEAAVAGLVRYKSAEIPQLLFANWSSHSPQLRAQIIDALLQTPERTSSLLDAVQSQQIPPLDIDASRRQRLLNSSTSSIQARAQKLLAGAINTDRQRIVDQYQQELTQAGDPALGQKVFARLCANCHRLQEVGHEVGPDLSALTDKSTPALLAAIFDPNRAVEAKYVSYSAITDEGLSFAGIITEQTGNSLSLMAAEGKQQVILRNNLDELVSTSKSLMPEGMEKDLKSEELRHLLAFLQQSKPPQKQRRFPGNRASLAEASFDGSISLQARKCGVYGEDLVYEKQYHNLGHWKNSEDYASWEVEVPHDGVYNVTMEWACPADTSGNNFLIQAEGAQLTGKVISTGSWDDYQQKRIGTLNLKAGRREVVVRSAGSINGYLFDLRSITLTPASK